MSQYCDSKVLETNWFDWLVSSAVPSLEIFRSHGLLWTKVLGKVADKDGSILQKSGKTFDDPCSPDRMHCIALPNPVYFRSNHDCPTKGTVVIDGKSRDIDLDEVAQELSLLSDSWLHVHDDMFIVQDKIIPSLERDGYKKERPTDITWHAVLTDVSNMCQGIATKFNPPSEDEHMELAQDALLQVVNKLVKRKLVFTPGRAPVFNLLTTTIYRCMYSIKNKGKNQRNGMHKLIDDMQAGVLPENVRSFRAGMLSKQRYGCRSSIKTH